MDKLTNCPQCGGILNDFGRCEFCGSKVYDFLCIDFGSDPFYRNSAKTYVRIKVGNNEVIAPVIVSRCDLTMEVDSYPTMDCTFYVVGDAVVKSEE